jgi:hypothetical protein
MARILLATPGGRTGSVLVLNGLEPASKVGGLLSKSV